jgi:PII-like signaling protein
MMRGGGEPEGELIMLKRKLGAETKARAGLEQSQKILEEELLQLSSRLESGHHERIELEKANRRLVNELSELRKSQAADARGRVGFEEYKARSDETTKDLATQLAEAVDARNALEVSVARARRVPPHALDHRLCTASGAPESSAHAVSIQ